MLAADNSTMTCFLCGSRFRHPRILPCLHTFCTDCILSLQTYPVIDQTDYSDTDSEVDWFPTRDIDCYPNVGVIQPPREFGSSEYLHGTPPRSRRIQRTIKPKITRSKSCNEKLETPEKSVQRRPISLNRSTSSRTDRKEGSSNKAVRPRQDIYNNKVTPTASPIPAGKRRIIMCPICWKEVQVSTTLQELPRNLIVERWLLEDVRRFSGTVLVCDLCNDISNSHAVHDNGGNSVTVRCLDCDENLCLLCEASHRRQKRTSAHTLVGVDHLQNANSSCTPTCRLSELPDSLLPTSETNMVPQKREQSKLVIDFMTNVYCDNKTGQDRTATCLEHPGEELKMFCVSCELNVCLECVILEHRSHDCQFVTRELFQNQMNDVDRLIQTIIPKVQAMDDQIKSLSQMKNWTLERSNAVRGDVNVFMDKFVEAVELHRKQLLAQVTSLCESKDKALAVAEAHLLQARAGVEQTQVLVYVCLFSQRYSQVLVYVCLFSQWLFCRFCPAMKGEVINNFQMFGRVIANQPSAVDSRLHGDGLNTARLERKCAMVLSVFDCSGLPYTDNDVTIDARIYYQGKEINVPINMAHLTGGAHQISFTPLYQGTHFLHVGVNGCSVQDSPFKFQVKAKWRRHVGTWVTSDQHSGHTDTDHVFGSAQPLVLLYTHTGDHFQCQPDSHYWTCCGKMTYNSECVAGGTRRSPVHQATF
ncbi:unnamed protein product [Candidula unifasciata]|uniref:B box-type domain-containing protein n=1 Tax=Candidula unifasciata TaxID=100452 RepID=A0A8S3Z601_9EUPU|nr:unnamed protein product [Candidula unifasciata]